MRQPRFRQSRELRTVGIPHVEWLDPDPTVGQQRATLADAASDRVPFEDALPVRRLHFYVGQPEHPGWYWCATNDRHVGHESKVEGHVLTLIDYDPWTVGVSSQPLVLWVPTANGTAFSHTPDFYVARADGTVEVIEVKLSRKREAYEATDRCRYASDAFAEVGWTYTVRCEPPIAEYRTVAFLHRYAHPMHRDADIAERLLEAATGPRNALELAAEVGPTPITLPTLWHLCWHHELALPTDRIPDRHTHVYPRLPDREGQTV